MISTSFHSPQADVVNWLSTRQYVHPHQPVLDALLELRHAAPFELSADTRIAGIDLSTRIGRLSRANLEALAGILVDSPHASRQALSTRSANPS